MAIKDGLIWVPGSFMGQMTTRGWRLSTAKAVIAVFWVKPRHDLGKVIDLDGFEFVDAQGHIGYRRGQ